MLQVDGQPGGTIYFSGGRISACETSGAPSLEVVLLRSRRIPETDWDAAFTAAAVGERQITAELVGRELIRRAKLEALLRIALADAMFALLSGQVNGWLKAPAADCLLPLAPSAQCGWLIAEATRRGQVLAAFPGPPLSAQDRSRPCRAAGEVDLPARPGPGRDPDPGQRAAHGPRPGVRPRPRAVRDDARAGPDAGRQCGGNNPVLCRPNHCRPAGPSARLPASGEDDRTVTGLPRRRKERAPAPRTAEPGRRNLSAIRMLWPRSEGNTMPDGAQ